MVIWKKKDFGFHFTLTNPLTSDEVDRWRMEVKHAVQQLQGGFLVFVNMIDCELIPADGKPILEDLQIFCKENGMIRSVVILGDNITVMQMKLIAKKTGIYEWERYIDASSHPDWEELGMNWIIHGIDPDIIAKSSVSCIKSQ